ncbi:hypothetical protein OG233_07125 [Streptomyces sp. NBC_01218]|uniref:hypothetical protein n=1 Tax=Streptomyces sp. NBC_01218 TaxID=2903780 RepID=UPI003FA34AB6|nr:hypothetical protein OG233_07125 [Streptomyces sp. NBC_01218]
MVRKPETEAEPKERRIDLNVPQVAGSAVAAVAAAVAASQLGVYGTIVGAGVMSVVATCGGSVFQHFFRRTGEQIREVTVQVTHPGGRQVAVRTRETTRGDGVTTFSAERTGAGESTRPMDLADDRTRMPGTGPAGAMPPEDDRTRLLRAFPAPVDARDEGTRQLRITPRGPITRSGPAAEFSEATTHGTGRRGRRKPLVAAVVVFLVSMLGITAFELASGNDLSGGSGTTVGSVVRGNDSGGAGPNPSGPSDPSTGTDDGDSGGGPTGSSTSPTAGTGQDEDGPSAPATSDDGGTATTPAPATTPADGAATPMPTPSAPGDGASVSPQETADGAVPGAPDTGAGGE